VIRIRPPRRYRPTLEILDGRRLLSGFMVMHPAVYPLGTVGPLPSGSRLAAFDEPPPLPNYSAPTWYVTGTNMSYVLASMMAGVNSNGQGAIITHVKYTVSGALGQSDTSAQPGQVWTTSTASFQRTTGIDHDHTAQSVADDSWNWFWDETSGDHAITVDATLANGQEFVGTSDMSIFQVNPISYTVTVAPPTMGYYVDGFNWGLFNGAGSSYGGVSYVAQLGAANGAFGGFIQLVNMQASRQGRQQDTNGDYTIPYSQTVAFPAGLYALDQPKGNSTPYYRNNYSVSLTPNGPPPQMVQVGGTNNWWSWNTGPYPWDEPGISVDVPGGSTPQFITSVSYTYSFKTYVDWMNAGGGHVEIDEADWLVQASATYTGPVNPTPSQSAYWNATNWSVNGQVTGPIYTSGDQLPVWSINVDDAKYLYTTSS
jgi:hypothetical protein